MKISPLTIRRIYQRQKVRFKNIKRGKSEIDFTDSHYLSLFHCMRAFIKQMEESQTQVIYLDETVLLFSIIRSKGWTCIQDRKKVDDSRLKVQVIALIVAMCKDGCLINYWVHSGTINAEVFV